MNDNVFERLLMINLSLLLFINDKELLDEYVQFMKNRRCDEITKLIGEEIWGRIQ